MALSFAFDPTKGETPQSVAQSRAAAQQLAARIFGRSPQNVGEGLNAIGQAFIARTMMDEAGAAQKAGLASGNDAFSQITSAITGQPSAPAAPMVTRPMGNTNIPVAGGEVVPNDGNAIPGTVGLNQRLADLSQDFIQDNPGTYQSSGVRSTADQARLYADRENNPNPVAAPGTSKHERGMAVDIGGMSPEQRAMLPQFGLGQPVANDPPHVELASPAAPVQVASNDPRFAPATAQSDGAALPPNAQPTQGTMPQRSAGPTTQQLMQAVSNPWLSEGQRSVVSTMLKQRLEQEQQASDPLRQLQIKKAERDLADGKNPESVREFEYAAKNGFEGSFQDWIASKRAGAGEYSLTPVYGKDKDGNTILIQPGKSGTAIQTKLPEGVSISSGIEKMDLGSQWGIIDKRTGQIVGYQPKDLRGAEREKGIGEAQGKAVASAPADIQSGQNALDIIGKIRKDPYIDRGTGFSSLLNVVPGSGGYDFSNLVEQAKSGAFLQAIQQMRGLGSLSNSEGGAATAAITRMNTATSKEAFLDAVADYEKIVKQGMDRARGRLANPSGINPVPISQGKTSAGVAWSVE